MCQHLKVLLTEPPAQLALTISSDYKLDGILMYAFVEVTSKDIVIAALGGSGRESPPLRFWAPK